MLNGKLPFTVKFYSRILLLNVISVPGFFVFGGGVVVGGALAAGLVPNFLSLTSLLEAFMVSMIIPSEGEVRREKIKI
jgi:uncharacterized SAM-binding protein YcdF (DUF218 family)